MKGDFSRVTFDARNHFSRVLMQQGRVQLDADWNEQSAIVLHYLQTLAADLIGGHGGPEGGGFELRADADQPNDVRIGTGRYYVDGILCEHEPRLDVDGAIVPHTYLDQPSYPRNPDTEKLAAGLLLAYLDIWERHVTALDQDGIREKALGGPDTASRAQTLWQVKVLPIAVTSSQTDEVKALVTTLKTRADELIAAAAPGTTAQIRNTRAAAENGLAALSPALSTARMAARLDPGMKSDNACAIPPAADYRGQTNQLYRVEIHEAIPGGTPTFKWSRDNGSVASAWLGAGDEPGSIGVGSVRGFTSVEWVELTHQGLELRGEPGTLVHVAGVQDEVLLVDPTTALPVLDALAVGPTVRRWDQRETAKSKFVKGAIPIQPDVWIDLEDGIQVRFPTGGAYRTGDYWLIPARAATGMIEWPMEATGAPQPTPAFLSPRGIAHRVAPLAVLSVAGDGAVTTRDLRRIFKPA